MWVYGVPALNGYALYGGVNWNDFVTDGKHWPGQNCGYNVTSYLQNGTRLYNWCVARGTDGYALYNGLNWRDFVTKWAATASQNLRLIISAVYVQNNVVYTWVFGRAEQMVMPYGMVRLGKHYFKMGELATSILRLINLILTKVIVMMPASDHVLCG